MRTIYEIKVELKYIEPAIWRIFCVPADITMDRLHKVIQIVMGWENYHLYEFRTAKHQYGVPDKEYSSKSLQSAKKTKVAKVLRLESQKIEYIYDFGDNWEHTVTLQKILMDVPEFTHFYCLGGERACPPEDCGSYSGYYDIVEQLTLPVEKRNPIINEWLGSEYNSDAFDLEYVNRRLKRLKV